MQHHFAHNLSILRQKKGLSWEAALQRFLGWNYWENGNMEPSLEDLLDISAYFGISIDHLLKHKQLPLSVDIQQIKLLLLDIDGVMTQGGMFYTEKGDRMKCFNAKDGLALNRAAKTGLQIGIVSATEDANIVAERAKTLKITRLYTGRRPKLEIVTEWLAEMNLTFENVAYIGDDLNDLPVMQKVAVAACPNDAATQVRDHAHIILHKKGGEACVREFLEEILQIPLAELGSVPAIF